MIREEEDRYIKKEKIEIGRNEIKVEKVKRDGNPIDGYGKSQS